MSNTTKERAQKARFLFLFRFNLVVFLYKRQDLRLRHDRVVQSNNGGVGVDDRRGDAFKDARLEMDDPESDHNVCYGHLLRKGGSQSTKRKRSGDRAGSPKAFVRQVGWLIGLWLTRHTPLQSHGIIGSPLAQLADFCVCHAPNVKSGLRMINGGMRTRVGPRMPYAGTGRGRRIILLLSWSQLQSYSTCHHLHADVSGGWVSAPFHRSRCLRSTPAASPCSRATFWGGRVGINPSTPHESKR